MSFRQRLNRVSPERDTVITIGVFDGVHRGHSHLLQRLISLARPDLQPAALTFSNHPVTVLQPGREVSFLSTPEEKEGLIRKEGIEQVVSLEFTPELAQLSAREFVSLLVEKLRMKGLVVGPDFALGRNREGNTERLAELGREFGFFVDVLEPLLLEGMLVKSRVIRQQIAEGDVATTARLLGREFALTGKVVSGDRRGRAVGLSDGQRRGQQEHGPAGRRHLRYLGGGQRGATAIGDQYWRPAHLRTDGAAGGGVHPGL